MCETFEIELFDQLEIKFSIRKTSILQNKKKVNNLAKKVIQNQFA